MPSGGARARSGPGADPNALRRFRTGDKSWTNLPEGPYDGPVPANPLLDSDFADDAKNMAQEQELWNELWTKPQANMWLQLGLVRQVAFYCRKHVEATKPDAPGNLVGAVLRMEAELGLSTVGMNQLRWRIIAEGEQVEQTGKKKPAEKPAKKKPETARERRMKLVGGTDVDSGE